MDSSSRLPFDIGDWTVRPARLRLERAEESRRLEPKVMQVLLALTERAGEVVSKQELLDEVWRDTFVADGVLLRSISELRRAFGDDAKAPRYIETIPKRGYRLLAAVVVHSQPESPSDEPEISTPSAKTSLEPGHVELEESGQSPRGGLKRLYLPLGAIFGIAAVAALPWWPEKPAPETKTAPIAAAAPPPDAYARATEYLRRGGDDAANAVELFKRALEREPDHAPSYAGLALAYSEAVDQRTLGREWMDAALDAGRRAVSLDPELAAAHLAHGTALAHLGRRTEALAALQRAIELEAPSAEKQLAWRALGRLHLDAGRLDEAVRAFIEALGHAGTSAALHAELALSWRLLGDPEATAAELEKSLALEPFEPRALWLRGRLAFDSGELITARDVLRPQGAAGGHPDVLDLAGLVELAAGERDAAVDLFERALTAGAGSFANLHRASLLGAENDERGRHLATVEAAARDTLDRGSESWRPYVLLAGVAALRGELEAGHGALDAAIEAGWRDLQSLDDDPAFRSLTRSERHRHRVAKLEASLAETRRRLGSLRP